MNPQDFRICSFESRRATEMASLISKLGGVPTIAPSMREIPLTENIAALDFGERLLNDEFQTVVFMTGVGARALLDVLKTKFTEQDVFAALNRTQVVIRGPKPQVVLREWGVKIDARAAEPNTWRELLTAIGEVAQPLAGRTIAVQEYGKPNDEFYAALNEGGAVVTQVPVYSWQLPEDLGPLEAAIRGTISGDFDCLMFTSAQQVRHCVQVAENLGLATEWLSAARSCLIASIGPTCTETLDEYGLTPDIEPEHPKMGPLVKAACEAGIKALTAKRASG